VKQLDLIHSPHEVRDDWLAIGPRSGNLFATWEWAACWWEHYGAHAGANIVVARRDGVPVAIVPLVLRHRGPLGVLRFLGHGPSDQLGPITAPEHAEDGADALELALKRLRWSIFVGEQLPAGLADRLGGVVVGREGSPVLPLVAPTWDAFLATRSRNFREQLRRKERKLRDLHEIEFRLADDPRRLPSDLDALFRLHRARWEGRKTDFSRDEAFHRAFADLALDRGWLRLWLLEADGLAVAAWLGFRYAGRELYYQSGRDPAWDESSVGFILLMHSIREALESGADAYCFLRGDEAYKYRFATDDPGLETVALGRGPFSRRAVAVLAAARSRLRGRASRGG
jgi:CelD/BcsL family acetyltransferase involved in cellulose biosynthesis